MVRLLVDDHLLIGRKQKILHVGRIFNYVGKSRTVILEYLTLSSILLIVRRQLLQAHRS